MSIAGEASVEGAELSRQVEQILGEPVGFTDGWSINRIREDGAIDAYIPRQRLDVEGIPVDPLNVDRLIGLFNDYAKETGGTGQRDAIVVGHVRSEALYTLDGFHRYDVQGLRGVGIMHCTLEPNLTYEQVVQRRLEYANTHPEVEFPRQVELAQSIWERTAWSETIPNVLTAFRAVQEDYALDRASAADVPLIDSLPEDTYAEICEWVRTLAKSWGLSPKEIREKLSESEGFDRELMRFVYQRPGRPPAGRIGLGHIAVITETYPGEPDLQGIIVEEIIKHELTIPESRKLVDEIESGAPITAADARSIIMGIDVRSLKRQTRKKIGGTSRAARTEGRSLSIFSEEHARQLTIGEFLGMLDKTLPEVIEASEASPLSPSELDMALNLSLQLADLVAAAAERANRP